MKHAVYIVLLMRNLAVALGLIISGCSDKYFYGKPPYEAADASEGCALSFVGFANARIDFELRNSSDDAILDTSVVQESRILSRTFGVNPGLIYFIDDRPNAYATPARYLDPGHDGTVLFGLNLMRAEQNNPNWGAAINGILAHEWAHIVQQNTPALRIMPTPWKELHADFLAGWYMGLRSIQLGNRMPIEGFARSVYGKGDRGFFDPDHHGTPEQRMIMMYEGYYYARNSDERGLQAAMLFGAKLLRFEGIFIQVLPTR